VSGWRSKLLIGSNHKMYKTTAQILAYLRDLEGLTSDLIDKGLDVFVLPPYTSLPAAASEIDQTIIHLGAQNMCWEEAGQFTGEISPVFLEEIGVRLVMIGHSDRRNIFGEDDLTINKKVLCGLLHQFTVLLCVGETAQEKEFGVGVEQIRRQLKIALHRVEESQLSNVWIAYEPVWAIGQTGIPATPEYADSIHFIIRQTISELFPENGPQVPILYGGSVNPDNAADLLRQPYTDGLFIGRTAWDAERFAALIHKVYPVWQQKNSVLT
jgi:L-erythrulose 1-phosphate isomerase